ncbi:IS1096 element passenger TnpR family protein [Microbacter margulisiae]|uniref:Plasmid pRiA4b Orf3-like domain-containing protein n=1 Tax=Microbacter margulisiae TaxID=1350067 RepID=A0A7W5DPS6_9PORP|nr:hypothetical protein [Microbacter margulisiae]MBB3186503.1 hypothetical protein [Microbacter margulisiae]
MLYKFLILSDEVDNFVREITIDSSATFLALHEAILDSVHFEKDQITSFFLCNDDWEKQQEITLIEMETDSETDNLVMENTVLEDYVTEEKQKMIYVFDMLSERCFYMTLKEMIPRQYSDEVVCSLSEGNPPKQIETVEIESPKKSSPEIDEQFYGDEDYDMDELDEEGFGDIDFQEDSSI